MSHAYSARFSAVELSLAEALARLEGCLSRVELRFDNEVVHLKSRRVMGAVVPLATSSVASLAEVCDVAKRWWGISLSCISTPLARVLGRTDAMEVYLRVLKAGKDRCSLEYSENAAAFRARASSADMAAHLELLLVTFSDALGADVAIYAEENLDLGPPDLQELQGRLELQRGARQPAGWMGIVSRTHMGHERATQVAGPWSSRVKEATTRRVVLSFL